MRLAVAEVAQHMVHRVQGVGQVLALLVIDRIHALVGVQIVQADPALGAVGGVGEQAVLGDMRAGNALARHP